MTHYLSELAKMPRNYAVSFQVWNIISFWTCFILKACFAATQAGSFLFNSPRSSSKNLFHCCLLTVRSTSVSEGYFKTDPNYSSLENTTFIRLTLQALLWIFLMGAKPGRNKRSYSKRKCREWKRSDESCFYYFLLLLAQKESPFALLLESAVDFLLAIQ